MKHIFILVLFLSTISTYAQDDLLAALEAEDSLSGGPSVINSTWKSTYLINYGLSLIFGNVTFSVWLRNQFFSQSTYFFVFLSEISRLQ